MFPDYNTAPINPNTRIFLISGGAKIGNFLQEVVDQRRHWLSQGYRADQIACYYVKPSRSSSQADAAQYKALASQTRGFYMASPNLIYDHLETVARTSPDAIYLYSTSHGRPPLNHKANPTPAERSVMANAPILGNQYTLAMDAGPTGRVTNQDRAECLQRGYRPDDLLMTPRYLKSALSRFPSSTKKVVVLQGCYAGGFVRTNDSRLQRDTLTGLPNISVFTASRHDRASFGCSATGTHTYFGKLFLDGLRGRGGRFERTNWNSLSQDVTGAVSALEWKMNLPENKHSHPVFFSNS